MQHDFYFYLGDTRRLMFQQVSHSATLTEQHLRVLDFKLYDSADPLAVWQDAQQWAGIPVEVETKPSSDNAGT